MKAKEKILNRLNGDKPRVSGYCNKCDRFVEDMNELEIKENMKEGSFVCSDCINREMDEE